MKIFGYDITLTIKKEEKSSGKKKVGVPLDNPHRAFYDPILDTNLNCTEVSKYFEYGSRVLHIGRQKFVFIGEDSGFWLIHVDKWNRNFVIYPDGGPFPANKNVFLMILKNQKKMFETIYRLYVNSVEE